MTEARYADQFTLGSEQANKHDRHAYVAEPLEFQDDRLGLFALDCRDIASVKRRKPFALARLARFLSDLPLMCGDWSGPTGLNHAVLFGEAVSVTGRTYLITQIRSFVNGHQGSVAFDS
jgi:hypothetical protein